MVEKTVDVSTPTMRRKRRLLWFGASLLARMILVVSTLAIVIGAPVAALLLLDLAGWTAGVWFGFLAGLIVAFAVWWAYLILYDSDPV